MLCSVEFNFSEQRNERLREYGDGSAVLHSQHSHVSLLDFYYKTYNGFDDSTLPCFVLGVLMSIVGILFSLM